MRASKLGVPRGAAAGAEISEILFDDNGDMLVAERGAPTGAYDYKALAEPGENRVLRFRPKAPGRSAEPRSLVSGPEEYAVGFPPNFATAMAASPSATATIRPEISTAPSAAARSGAPANSCATRATPQSFSACKPAARSLSMACRAMRFRWCGR